MSGPSAPPRPPRDEARFYTIDGRRLPSVTTILSVIAKPGLGPWYAREERRHFETAMLEVASRYRILTGEQLLNAVIQAVDGVKAADREKQRAARIGTAVHAAIEWHLRTPGSWSGRGRGRRRSFDVAERVGGYRRVLRMAAWARPSRVAILRALVVPRGSSVVALGPPTASSRTSV